MNIHKTTERYQSAKEQLQSWMDVRDMDRANLAAEIERCRIELNNLGTLLGEIHPNVLEKSRQLDELILQHMVGI
ncbi:aspartyl-phosphate phosphatase Spo0E family protein [Paenibacillus vietnamensis]|uniref:aspartyl-phosphate phosphatase Spo0E family protein n=1 Tax=Paenibacillus vietnamensis TaxID=2590547 RepID=UPI001CD136AB|nr:aspartyl-phosphate phosphatase Spo0E family protein [Paenibacillus vietnamensis]